ncbi:hypothetical protein JXQ70_12950 [bacterium]|nr:hypothetical protein [bacterium]
MTDEQNRDGQSSPESIIDDFFHSPDFRHLFAQIMSQELPEHFQVNYVNETGQDPLPDHSLLNYEENGTLSVDISRATSSIIAAGLMGRIEIQRLVPVVKQALENICAQQSLFNIHDLGEQLGKYESIPDQEVISQQVNVHHALLELLEDEHKKVVLTRFLEESEENKIRFMALIYRFGIPFEYDKHVPFLANWLEIKIHEQKGRVDQAVEVCEDEASLSATLQLFSKGIENGSFLGEYSFLRKRDLLNYLKQLEPPQRERIAKVRSFHAQIKRLGELLARIDESSEARNSEMLEFVRLERDLTNLVPFLKADAILLLIETFCQVITKVLNWKPERFKSLSEALAYTSYLHEGHKFIEDRGKDLARLKSLPDHGLKIPDPEAIFKAVKTQFTQSKSAFYKCVVFEIQPMLEELTRDFVVEHCFAKTSDVRLTWETLISHIQSFENNKALFSGQFYAEIMQILERATQVLKDELIRFVRLELERIQNIPGLSSPGLLRQKLTESVNNLELARDIVDRLETKNVTVELFQVLYGAYLPEALLELQQTLHILKTSVTDLTNSVLEKETLLHSIAEYFLDTIDPDKRKFKVELTPVRNGMKYMLKPQSGKRKSHDLTISWISYQTGENALVSLESSFFRSPTWLLHIFFPKKVTLSEHKGPGKKAMDTLYGQLERAILKYSLVDVRESINALGLISDPKISMAIKEQDLIVQWFETILKENEILKPDYQVGEYIQACSPIRFLEEMRLSGATIVSRHLEALRDYLSHTNRIEVDLLIEALKTYFAVDNHYFIPIQCSDGAVPLQVLINQWLEKAGADAFEDIYFSFRGMIDILSAGTMLTRQTFNVSSFSESEQQLFELLKLLPHRPGGKNAFLKMADIMESEEGTIDLDFFLDRVIREQLITLDENLTLRITKTITSQFERLRQKEYERNIFLQMEIAEALLEMITMFHERNLILWNIKPGHILVEKKGKELVRLSLINCRNCALVKSGYSSKEAFNTKFSGCSFQGNEMYIHPYCLKSVEHGLKTIPLYRMVDLHMATATILELFLGRPLLGESYARLLEKYALDHDLSTLNVMIKEYYGQMNRSFERVRNTIGDFNWSQQIHRFILHSDDIFKKDGFHPLLEHAPNTPYFIKPGEKTQKFVHFYRKSDEALTDLNQKQIERIIADWLKGIIKRFKPDYVLNRTVGRRLRWNYQENVLEIVYSIIHYNPGKSIIVGLRFNWSIRKGFFTHGNDDLIISIALDLYRTISYSVITRGLVDAKLRDQFIHFMTVESAFRQKVTELKDIIVFSSPDKYLDILSGALGMNFDSEKSLIVRMIREKRGFLGINDLLKNFFIIDIDGRDYLIQPYKFLEGQTLEAWIRKDENLAIERDMLRDVLETFIDRTIPWCELTSPENWARELQGLGPDDWGKLRVFFDQFNFHKQGTLLQEEKLEQEKLLNEILGAAWDINDQSTTILLEGLALEPEKQRPLVAYLLHQKENKKNKEEELAEKNRKFVNDITLVKLAMFYHICHENLVIHRDIKPANIMIKPIESPSNLFVDVKIIDTEGTLWKDGPNIHGFYPEALISITPDYASPYILQWLLEHSSEGHRYFDLLQEYDAFSLFIIFYELLQSRSNLKEIEHGIYDEYCLKISTLIRDPLFMGYIYAKNEHTISYDFSPTEFIDQFNFEELIINLKNDFGLTCSASLDALNELLRSNELYHHLRQAVQEDELKDLDVMIGNADHPDDRYLKKHNRFLMAKIFPQICPKPPETKQSLLHRYQKHILEVTQNLVDAQDLFETLLLNMYASIPDDQIKYTLYHWFLQSTGIDQKFEFKQPENRPYGELQYHWYKSDTQTKNFVLVERTPAKIELLKIAIRESNAKILTHDGKQVLDPQPLSPIRAFLLLGKRFINEYRGLVRSRDEDSDERLLSGRTNSTRPTGNSQ